MDVSLSSKLHVMLGPMCLQQLIITIRHLCEIFSDVEHP